MLILDIFLLKTSIYNSKLINNMKQFFANFFKGFGMGAANVIPGVSGGTIALITGIFERLIDSIKSFDLKALKLIFKGKFKEFAKYTDIVFLISVFFGAGISIISLARVLEYFFDNYPIFIWSYFFGLILASVYFVGRTIEKWKISVIISFIIGAAMAVVITILNPAKENSNFIYLIICGMVGVCSMILPGLSGSFILILMGNYELIMIDAVNNLSSAIHGDFDLAMQALKIIAPVAIGIVVGLIAFSHLLSWIYKKFKNQTIAVLTGFIFGSLSILWPWKNSFDKNKILFEANKFGKLITFTEDDKIYYFEKYFPQIDSTFFIAVGLVIVGIASIWLVEKLASKKVKKT